MSDGQLFLIGYAILAIFSLVLLKRYYKLVDNSSYLSVNNVSLNTLEIGYLRGGFFGAVEVMSSEMMLAGHITMSQSPSLVIHRSADSTNWTNLQELVYAYMTAQTDAAKRYSYRKQIEKELEPVKQKLTSFNLIFSDSAVGRKKMLSKLVPFVLLLIGIIRITSGLMNNKPVLYLFLMTIGVMVYSIISYFRDKKTQWLTDYGRRYLSALREQYKDSYGNLMANNHPNMNDPQKFSILTSVFGLSGMGSIAAFGILGLGLGMEYMMWSRASAKSQFASGGCSDGGCSSGGCSSGGCSSGGCSSSSSSGCSSGGCSSGGGCGGGCGS